MNLETFVYIYMKQKNNINGENEKKLYNLKN